MSAPNIDIMDIVTTEDASMLFADVMDELHRQMAIINFTLADVESQGRGEWLEKLRSDVEIIQLYLDESAAMAVEISDYLFDMVNVFRGDSALVDGDIDDFE